MENRPTAAALAALLVTAPLFAALFAAPAAALPPPAYGSSTALSNPFNESADVHMAYSANGEGLAVWREYNSSTNTVWSKRYTPGVGWSPPVFHYAASSSVGYLTAAMDDAGTGTILWVTFSAPQRLLYTRASAGTTPSPPTILHNASGTFSGAVAMRLGGSGTMFAFWSQSGPSQSWAVVVDSSGSVDGPVRVDGGSSAVFEKDVLPDPKGPGASALWCDRAGSVANLTVSRYDPTAGWSTPEVVSANLSNGCNRFGADIDASGNIVVAFYASINASLVAIRHRAGGEWEPPVPFWQNTGPGLVDHLAVRMSADGRSVVTWTVEDFILMRNSAYGTSDTDTGRWRTPATLALNVDSPLTVVTAGTPQGHVLALYSPRINGSYYPSLAQFTRLPGCSGWSGPTDLGLWSITQNYLAAGLSKAGQGHILFRVWAGSAWQVLAVPVSLDIPRGAVTVTSPAEGTHYSTPAAVVEGLADAGAFVTAGGARTQVSSDGTFALPVPLLPGANSVLVEVELEDPWEGCSAAAEPLTIFFDDPVPGLVADLESTRAELNATQQLLWDTQADLGAARARIDALEASGNATEAKLDAARADLDAANDTLTGLVSELTELATELNATMEELGRVKVQFPWLEANLTAAQAQVASMEATIATLTAQNSASQVSLAEAQSEILLLKARENQTTTVLQDTADNNADLANQVAMLSLFTFIALIAAIAAIAAIAVGYKQSRGGGGAGVSGVYSEKASVSQAGGEHSPAEEQLKGAPRH